MKISDESNHPAKPVLDRSELSVKYPQAKTFEQREVDRLNRELASEKKSIKRRRASVQAAMASLMTMLIAGASLYFVSSNFGPVVSALMAFPLGLIGFGALIWAIRSTISALKE